MSKLEHSALVLSLSIKCQH